MLRLHKKRRIQKVVFDLPTSPHQEIALVWVWKVYPDFLDELIAIMIPINQKVIPGVMLSQGLRGALHGIRRPHDLDSQDVVQQCPQRHLV